MRRFTPDDIRREHEAAMASLTDAQRCGIGRQRHAHQMTNFNGLSDKQNLQLIFEREARERNAALEEEAAAEATLATAASALQPVDSAEACCANDNAPAPAAPRSAEG
jgi:hypothetical protein